MKSFMAWEYNMTKPTAYFEQNMVISQYQKHIANQSASLGEHLGVLDPRLQDM